MSKKAPQPGLSPAVQENPEATPATPPPAPEAPVATQPAQETKSPIARCPICGGTSFTLGTHQGNQICDSCGWCSHCGKQLKSAVTTEDKQVTTKTWMHES